ncbi:hypothetical protein [Novosphingobium sp.]|uniref:hypothetical protein n=1 Tax=Novosphingobium sp. TaxID=1874826 RepID=UPI00286ABF70|nr:hypothetical protein [Novosphingobium sp.]
MLPAVLLGGLLLRPIHDVDIFWQLRLGELALDHGKIVATEPFAAHHLGEPLAPLAWLGQIAMAAVRRLGGWSMLQVFDLLIWLGGFLAAAIAVRRKLAAPAGVVAALMLAFASALPFSSLRPQSFAVLCFGLLIALQTSQRRWEVRLLSGAVLLVLWQNLHPSVAVGVLYLAAMAGWAWIEKLTGRSDQAPWQTTALALFGGLAIFLTPMGTGFIAISASNAAASSAMDVTEWHSVWSPVNGALWPYLVLVPIVFLVVLLLHRTNLDWTWLFPSLVLLIASAFVIRFNLFWAISTIPVLAPMLTPQAEGDRTADRDCALALIGFGVAASLALALYQPRFDQWLPLRGVATLKAAAVHGTVFGELPWGGPLIDRGHPDWRVALDGRYYVYSDAELSLARTVGTSPTGLDQIERSWAPSAVLLDPRYSSALIAQLRRASGTWRELRTGDASVAFVRIKASAPAGPTAP